MSLVVLTRPNAAVLCGRVADIVEKGDISIIIMRETNGEYNAEIMVDYRTDFLNKMKVRVGSLVIMTTSPDPGLEILEEGGVMSVQRFHVRGYSLRYSGQFDFESTGRAGEKHVFFGTITSAGDKKNAYGNYIATYEVSFRSGRDNTIQKIKAFDSMVPDGCAGKKAVFITGKNMQRHNDDYFWADKMIVC